MLGRTASMLVICREIELIRGTACSYSSAQLSSRWRL